MYYLFHDNKNWAYTHNFRDVVAIIAHCGGKEISTHLMGPKNATYISPEYSSKYINIKADFVKKSLDSTMKEYEFTFYCDETQGITSVELLALYVTFIMNGEVFIGFLLEHFIGFIPISKVVGIHMFAVNIMSALENFFKDLNIPLRNARSACMDSTNVNSGVPNGLKYLLQHSLPMLWWVRCNNHKLVLCFKHLIPQFATIYESNAFLLSLWKFFKYHPLPKNFLDESATRPALDLHGDSQCPPYLQLH